MRLTLKVVALAGASVLALSFNYGAAWAQDSITVASWGGSFQDAERAAFFEPAAETLGITIKEATTNGIADLRAQVQSGNPTWDVVELGSSSCVQAVKENLVVPLNFDIVNTDGLPDEVVGEHWVGIIFFANVIAWNTKTVQGEPPSTWADFWDTEKYPGARTMYAKPYYNLEAAMLADGVPPEEVYPIDVDRAFDKLAEIRDEVAVWWRSGAQSAQLVKDGEVDYALIWNGRVGTVIEDGAPADFTFNQAILDFDCLVVPKGSDNVELAMKAINEFISPEKQAQLPLHINYGPVNNKAFELGVISEKMAMTLPSSPKNREKSVIYDPEFWVGRMNELQERFDFFVQQ